MNALTRWMKQYKQGYQKAKIREAEKLDARMTKKALRRAPHADVLVARVIFTSEAQMLMSQGWTLSHSNRLQQGGSDLVSEHWLEKPAPGKSSSQDES